MCKPNRLHQAPSRYRCFYLGNGLDNSSWDNDAVHYLGREAHSDKVCDGAQLLHADVVDDESVDDGAVVHQR